MTMTMTTTTTKTKTTTAVQLFPAAEAQAEAEARPSLFPAPQAAGASRRCTNRSYGGTGLGPLSALSISSIAEAATGRAK